MGKSPADIKHNFDRLPKTAGVYLFYSGKPASAKGSGEAKELIYIGKAINIKERVKNHFLQPTFKDALFIDSISRIDFIETNSEIEALLLEASLIKKNQPKFNQVWRDDKNYFYVAISDKKRPMVYIAHQKKDPQAKYIGPFTEGNALKKTLKFLRRVFPYYTAATHPIGKCPWCHLDLCPGPNPDLAAYKQTIKKLELILEGKRKTVLYALRREMEILSKANQFEDAAKVRDKISALEQIMQHAQVISKGNATNTDWDNTQKKMREIIGVKARICKIECYDISNIQGKFAVASMVVFVNGAPDKSQYKKFRIRMKNEPNDIAMLNEVLTRRLLHPEWGYPEIMLIDGGIAQLNVAIKAKRASDGTKNIKVISIAKGKRELIIEGMPKIPLKDLPQDVYNTIVALDDEAHRFAITYHRKVRKKHLLQ